MFDSGLKVKNIVEELKSEVDIALDIPNATYVQWLNSLQQVLYTEIIKEQKETNFMLVYPDWNPNPEYRTLSLSDLDCGEKESQPRFEDICAIYKDGVQLIKTTLASGSIFPNSYCKWNNDIDFNITDTAGEYRAIHIVRPALIDVDENDEIDNSTVMLPIEFIELAKAKLRGEAYKLANEDDIAAKWLNDYNVLLETFKAWIAEKSPNFGM